MSRRVLENRHPVRMVETRLSSLHRIEHFPVRTPTNAAIDARPGAYGPGNVGAQGGPERASDETSDWLVLRTRRDWQACGVRGTATVRVRRTPGSRRTSLRSRATARPPESHTSRASAHVLVGRHLELMQDAVRENLPADLAVKPVLDRVDVRAGPHPISEPCRSPGRPRPPTADHRRGLPSCARPTTVPHHTPHASGVLGLRAAAGS